MGPVTKVVNTIENLRTLKSSIQESTEYSDDQKKKILQYLVQELETLLSDLRSNL